MWNKTKSEIIKTGECANDHGGYFIIRGKERAIIAQERINYNIVYVFKQKNISKYDYIAEIRSVSEMTGHSVLLQCKISPITGSIYFSVPYINTDIPVGIVFKAFGFLDFTRGARKLRIILC